jgi:hypothetical protein
MAVPSSFDELFVTQRQLKRIPQIVEMVEALLKEPKHLRTLPRIGADPVIIYRCNSRIIEAPVYRAYESQCRQVCDYVINDGHHRLTALFLAHAALSNDSMFVCDMSSTRRPTGNFLNLAGRYSMDVYMRVDSSLMLDTLTCNYHRKYKGIKPPKCFMGEGCISCWKKYNEVQSRNSLEEAHPQGYSVSRQVADEMLKKLQAASIESL